MKPALLGAVAVLSALIAGLQFHERTDGPGVTRVSLHVAGALVLEVAFGSTARGDAAGGDQ